MEALNQQQSNDLVSRARVDAYGSLTSTATARAEGTVEARSTIGSGSGSVITSSDIEAHAESDYTLMRDPQASADTVVSTLVREARNVVRAVTRWLPWPFNKIVEYITETIFVLVEVFDFSDANSQVGGTGLNAKDKIDLNGDIYNDTASAS
jgi:hypothetical protein